MKKNLQELAALAASWAPDALMTVGAGAIAYGAWLMYQPAGFMVGGAFVLTAGVLAARKAA
jgi:hypothetical protein